MFDLLLAPFRLLYRAVRRIGIVDVTRLMHLPSIECQTRELPRGYSVRTVCRDELARLIATESVPLSIGQPASFDDERRALVATFCNEQLVSFLWLAKQSVDGADNFSRSEHLGTSIAMPDGTAFVYNAWTSPEHRGNGLISCMLTWSIRNRVVGAWAYLTMMDWTNKSSCRAFKRTGMRHLGWVVRLGRGRYKSAWCPRQPSESGLPLLKTHPG